MAATGLLYVGAVLFLNGTSLLGWSKGNSNAPLNILVGILQVVTPFFIIFTSNGDAATILGASGLFLFGFTYLYVAMNGLLKLDGSGLGWFCGYVALAAIVYTFLNYRTASDGGTYLAALWIQWAFLWGLFWLVLAKGRSGLTAYTGAVCLTQGIITGMIPAFFLLAQPDMFTATNGLITLVVGIVLDVVYWIRMRPSTAVVAA